MSYNADPNLARGEDEDSYNFTHAPQMEYLISPSSAYLGLNEGLWQTNDMLPQLSNIVIALSHDRFAPSASPNTTHPSSHTVMAPPPTNNAPYGATSTMKYLPPAQPPMHPQSTITPQPYTSLATNSNSKLDLALHLCKKCLLANQCRMSYGTTIYLALSTCTICHGGSTSSVNSDYGAESLHSQPVATVSTSTPCRPATVDSNASSRTNKQNSGRSSTAQPPQERGGPFYCRHEGCNRGPGGTPFTRKDNKNTHEKNVHGVSVAERPKNPRAEQ